MRVERRDEKLENMNIFEAVSKDDIDYAKNYLAKGGEVNICAELEKVHVPLLAYSVSVDMLMLLLTFKGDVDFKHNDGDAAIHFFTQSNREELVHTLLINNVDTGVKSVDLGETPLHIAARHNLHHIVDMLINYGAKRRVRTKEGKTALEIAIANKHQECINLLRQPKKRNSQGDSPDTDEIAMYKKNLTDVSMDKIQLKKRKLDIHIQELKQERFELLISSQAEEVERCKQHVEELKEDLQNKRRKLIKLKTKVIALDETIEELEKTVQTHVSEIIEKEKKFFTIRKKYPLDGTEDLVSLHCPICLQIPMPPVHVFQCTNGHVYCGTCKQKTNMNNCPHCRTSIKGLNIRNRVLEELIQQTCT